MDTSTSDFLGVLVFLVALPVLLWAYSRIAARAGYSRWWALAVLVPLLNIVVVLAFASSTWPVEHRAQEAERRLRRLEDEQSRTRRP